MEQLIGYFNTPFFIIWGGFSSVIVLLSMLFGLLLVLKGVIPVWYRLGTSLSKRKIAIFAEDQFSDLKAVLIDSKMFNQNNIVQITKKSIKKADETSFYIIHYSCYKDDIQEIINMKKDSNAMIIYAPQNEGFIDKDILEKLNRSRNTIVVNFRGRLLNDVLVSMITTSFIK